MSEYNLKYAQEGSTFVWCIGSRDCDSWVNTLCRLSDFCGSIQNIESISPRRRSPPHVLYHKPHSYCFGIYHLHPSRTSVYFNSAHAHTYMRERSIKAFRAVRGKQEKKALSKNLLTQIWFASIYPAKKGKPADMASLVLRLPAGICHFSAVRILSHDCRVIWFNPTGARVACNTDSGLFSKGDWHAG